MKTTKQKRNQRAARVFHSGLAIFSISGSALYTWAAATTSSPDGGAIFITAALVFGVVSAMSTVNAIYASTV
jgi:hypothetical protein